MILNYTIYYLLCGLLIGLWLESMTRYGGDNVDSKERAALIILWPVMLVIFVYHFFKELLK